jgi:hypothetical protein
MILKNKWLVLGLMLMCFVTSCGVYSFTGAAIEGRTINVHFIENNARTVVPSLSATLTEKLRQRILSQSSLSQVNNDMTDYYVSVASVTGKETSLLNRLTITVSITFKNKLNEKANFVQSFSRFADFSSDQNIQNVEVKLISEISDQLADDIFNKAFVNW